MSETIPDDLRETVEQIASDLEDIHFNSRHGSWLESAKHIIARALVAERLASTERAAKILIQHFAPDQGESVDPRAIDAIRAIRSQP